MTDQEFFDVIDKIGTQAMLITQNCHYDTFSDEGYYIEVGYSLEAINEYMNLLKKHIEEKQNEMPKS